MCAAQGDEDHRRPAVPVRHQHQPLLRRRLHPGDADESLHLRPHRSSRRPLPRFCRLSGQCSRSVDGGVGLGWGGVGLGCGGGWGGVGAGWRVGGLPGCLVDGFSWVVAHGLLA